MHNRLVGALLLVAIGGILLLGGKYLLAYLDDRTQRSTSDAAHVKGRIRVAADSWIGYFPLCSKEMKTAMHRQGWLFECVDDKADYRGRMAALARGDYELAVATVDSYLLNGQAHDYPAAIIAVLDESKGGDAIVARKDVATSLDALRSGRDIRVAFTPNSPSHHLLKATAHHFDLPALLPPPGTFRLETEGSDKALARLLAGTTDIAVLWEPDVSRALGEPGVVKLLGTEDTERLIVDVLLAGRKYLQRQPEAVSLVLATYFKVLKTLRDDPERLRREVSSETGLAADQVEAMLAGVLWQGLLDNCEKWFGIAAPGGTAREQIVATIDGAVDILVATGDFSQSPVPDRDNYRLIKRSFLEDLYAGGTAGFTRGQGGLKQPTFPPLDAAGWALLAEVATLKLQPIVFRQGSADLDTLAGTELDLAAEKLGHYPNFRILVKGHTGTRGDAESNMLLSRQRAETVAEYLRTQHGIDNNRIHAKGLGGAAPLPPRSGEPPRAYEQRLLRVELVLVREEL